MMRRIAGIVFVAVMLVLAASAAWPQSGPAPAASRSTFMKLMKVQEYWEEDKYDAAVAALRELRADQQDDPYEFGLASQYLAHTYVLMDRPEESRQILEEALAKDGIHFQLLANLKLFYAQIVIADEEFELARQMFEDWLATTEEQPQASQLFSAAYANYMTDHFEEAERLVVRAIEGAANPLDAWHRLHYQILFELERFDEAEEILIVMINRKPNDEGYWRLLANHHLRREDNRAALAALAVAYQIEVLSSLQDMKHIMSLYSVTETPERAARMMQDLIDGEQLEPDFDNLKRLSDLWLLSRERGRAIETLERAAQLAPDGRTHEMLASLRFEDEQWREAYLAFTTAVRKGGIEDVYRLHLLAGISAMRAGMTEEARSALIKAAKSELLHSQARQMLRELDEA